MIIAMEIVEDKKIVSLCSRGVLAEWDLKALNLIDVFEVSTKYHLSL